MYPIVQVQTVDGLALHGLLTEPPQTAGTIAIHIHGAAGSFYGNSYFDALTHALVASGIAYLSTNNRGSGVYELEKGTVYHGVSLERFEDSVLDIDAWISFALRKGYKDVVLEGHSYGTEKIVYYMTKGKYREDVRGVILFGFSDNVGSQAKYEQEIGRDFAREARELARRGEGFRLLDDVFGLCGELPISAQTYLDCFTDHSENAIALPLRQGRDLTLFQAIHVPILAVIGDQEDSEYTVIPIGEAIELLKSENALAEVCQIAQCNHGFAGKETELAEIVEEFMRRRILGHPR